MVRSVGTNNGIIEYDLVRKRVKNINLRVRSDGTVAVSANPSVTLAQIERFVARNESFILSAKRKAEKQYPKDSSEYRTGATVCLWGKPYGLCVTKDRKNVVVCGDSIRLTLPDPDNTSSRVRCMRAFYQEECKRRIEPFCREAMNLFGRTEMPQISYRRMTSRWGSCNAKANRLTFNTALATVDPRAARYVVFHEFSHFLRQDHSPVFYQELEKRLPEWRQFREILKQEGRFI